MKYLILSLACVVVFLPGSFAQALARKPPTRLLSYEQGLEKAAAENSVAIVVLHGSDWNPLGEKLLTEVLPKFQSQKNVILADVDLLQNASDRESKSNHSRNHGWPGGKYSVPAVFAYGPDGKLYGVRNRLELYDSASTPEQGIAALIENSLKRLDLEQQISAAEKAGDAQAGLKLLAELMALPLDQPDIDLDRIEKLDPNDEFGILLQYKFPNLYSIIQEARRDADNGKGAEAVTRYNGMLKSKTLRPEQRALILLALGTVYHHSEGQADDAKQAFQNAIETASDSVAGKIAAQRLEQFYPPK